MLKQDNFFYFSDSVVSPNQNPSVRPTSARLNFNEFSQLFYTQGIIQPNILQRTHHHHQSRSWKKNNSVENLNWKPNLKYTTETDSDNKSDICDQNSLNITNFSLWTRKIRTEDNKLLPNLFVNYFNKGTTTRDKLKGSSKNYYQIDNKFNHNIDINGDDEKFGHLNTDQDTSEDKYKNVSTATDTITTLGRRRGVLRTMSENFNDDHFQQKCIPVKSVSFHSGQFNNSELHFEKKRRKDEQDFVTNPATELTSLSSSVSSSDQHLKMDKSQSCKSDNEPMSQSGDESSSTYSTAEEDHLESDPERRTSVMSDYTTPDASLANNHFDFPEVFKSKEEENLNDATLRIDSDFEDTLTNMSNLTDDDEKQLNASSKFDSPPTIIDKKISPVKETKSNFTLEQEGRRNNPETIKVKPNLSMTVLTNEPVTVQDLQTIFNYFKQSMLTTADCEALLESLGTAQRREDFQWALHQLGGFNALLFLFARVVEICPDDTVQSKGLSLVLSQLRNHPRLADGPAHRQYHLIRFVLNSEKCVFGFKTFIQVINFGLSASGLKLIDYQLLDTLLLSCWKSLTHVRCKESDAPTGNKSLFECLLTIILDLLEEKNSHRDLNLVLLKANGFVQTLLAICYHMIVDEKSTLNAMDGLRIASLINSILTEIMAPPDAYVAVTLVKFGLYPLLPRELPPLPRKEDAFFILHHPQQFSSVSPSAVHNPTNIDLDNAQEAQEVHETNDTDHMLTSTTTITEYDDKDKLNKEQGEEVNEIITIDSNKKEDVPELVGIFNNNDLTNGRKSSDSNSDASTKNESHSQDSSFSDTFHVALLEAIMGILLNTLSIIPDVSFHSVLNPHMNAHLFVAYCSHPRVTLKILALKLLSAYLTRVKNPVVVEFLKRKGFFLTSLYIQGTPEVSQLVVNICNGFGPLSYPLVIALLHSYSVVNSIIEWIQSQSSDQIGIIPALMSMGLFPSIFNIQAQSRHSKLQKPLQNLLSIATRFCALHPKEDSWKSLFCPSIESAYGTSPLVPRIIQEATEFLRRNKKKDLKKVDSNTRLMWLIERSVASGKMGSHFDKWLLNIFTLHIMELDEEEEMENWIHFVKKNKKKLNQLMGIFLCRIFQANSNKGKDMDLKHHTIRVLLTFCPNLLFWLPKVIKYDEQMERCFTAFFRIFISTAEQKYNKLNSHLKPPSFHSLISDNGNLTLTLQMASASTNSSHKQEILRSIPSIASLTTEQSEDHEEDGSDPEEMKLTDRSLRTKFESILIEIGILCPISNNLSSSTFSADFKNFKILLETPTSGVSPMELRQCLCYLEKMRTPYLLGDHNRFSTNSHHGGTVGASSSGGKHHGTSNCAYLEIFENVHEYAMEMLVHVARARTQEEVEVARRICLQDADVDTVKHWMNVQEQMIHPKAPWHFPDAYPNFCALDQSEGPGRVRTRLKREHLRVHNRFVMPKYRKSGNVSQPLEYLFQSCSVDLRVPLILNEIQYMRFCTRIIPGEELPGEIILTKDHLTFIAEHANFQNENVEVRKTAIKYLMKRRYTLEDRAVEIFLECRSFLFVFKTKKDREEFVALLALKPPANSNAVQFHSVNSSLMETSITSMTSQWLKGHLSNFEYLMYLNTASGRTYCDLMQYPVFPFVLSKYDSPTLDLCAPQSYRDLKKPMAIQDPSKEEHFVSIYNYLKRECDSAPFHYGSHYSNSGIVLHFLVRLPPYTQHFLKYQDGSFDIPDRSFHSLETTWRLASRESNTDFKEAIPEFFYLPEVLQNLQHFDLGVRQNGKRVDDVVLPPWAKGDARLFTLVNRQALESNHVRKYLCDWIDLIFGYKQSGKAGLQALNIFHPSTYEGFEVDGSGDELLMKARKAMVSTYGQTPKQLFAYPHPRPSWIPEEKCDMEVLDTVWGLRWGDYIGSPACPDLEVVHTREYQESISLFETNSRVVFWPENTLILGDSVVGYWNATSIRVKTTNVFNAIGDDITVCVGTTNSIWVGHASGRISVLKMSPQTDTPKVLETVELVGHYQAIKNIHVNQEFSMAISCATGEKYAIVWDINKYPKIAFNNTIDVPETVDDIYSSSSTGDVILLNKEFNRVTLATINGFIVGTVEIDEVIESACLSTLDPGRNVNVIAVGCHNGVIRFYSTWDIKFLNQLKVLPLSTLPIKSLRYSRQGCRLYCLSHTEVGAVTVSLSLTNSSDKN